MSEGRANRVRIRIISVLVALVGLVVVSRLFSLQVFNSRGYRERAEHQYITPIGSIFDRGNIYLTNKDGTTVAAATVSSGFKAAIVPDKIKDKEATFISLAAVIPDLEHEDFIAKASKASDPYEEIADRLDDKQAEILNSMKIPGLSLYREKWRFYPGNTLAAQDIGFVSYKKNDLVGNYGLEEYYNDVLSRENSDLYVNFFAEIFANVQSTIFKNTSTPGDLVTTLEPTLQLQLESSISKIKDTWASDSVGAIIMDPYTGEVLAMAHVPTFDLNNFSSVKDFSIFSNPFTQNVYEMGSIIKPIVMSSALDIGAVTPETNYTDNTGFVVVRDKTISNFDKKGRGTVNMQRVLNESLNTGMVFVGQKMGKDAFKDYILNRFHLGEKTGIDLPGEVNGLVSNLKDNNDVNFATAAFGQGIATSPINIVRAFASIANGGKLITPHLVKSIIQENGIEKKLEYKTSENSVLKPETVRTITSMLVHVVDDGYHKGLAHYSVAAKTGTAQIARPDGTGYYTDRNLHSLIGFFPSTNPRFVIYFFNVYPKNGALFAIQTLADPFFGMVEFLGNYYNIAPDR